MKDHDWATYGMNEAGAKLADQWIGKVQEIVDNVDAGVLESLLKEAKWTKSRRESAYIRRDIVKKSTLC